MGGACPCGRERVLERRSTARESRIVLVLVCVARSGKGVSLREGECSCERGRVFLGAGRHVLRGGPSFREAQCHWRRCIFV